MSQILNSKIDVIGIDIGKNSFHVVGQDRRGAVVRTLVTQLARSRLSRESGRMRADIHDGPEQTLQSEAGYSNARPHQPRSTKTSCTARPDHTIGSISAIGR